MNGARLNKFSKYLAAVLSVSVLTLGIAPAEAAVPGGACTKANAKIKIGGERYTCTKNPVKKSKKLVWVWQNCIAANTEYQKALTAQKDIVAKADKAIAEVNTQIEALKAKIAENEAEAKSWDAKAADYKAQAAEALAKADELKAKALEGGITSVNPSFKRNAQAALFDGKLTVTEVKNLAKTWGTTEDKVSYILLYIAAEDRIKSANQFKTGVTNAERTAASLRSTRPIEQANNQIKSTQTSLAMVASQVDALKTSRKSDCDVEIWKAVS